MSNSQKFLQESLLSEQEEESSKKQVKNQREKYLSMNRKIIGGTNFISKLFFTWIFSLLRFGSKQKIDIQSLPTLPQNMKSTHEVDRFRIAFQQTTRSKREGMTLIKTLGSTYKKSIIFLMFLSLFNCCLAMYTPILTSQTINFINEGSERDAVRGIILFLGIIIIVPISSLGYTQMFFEFSVLGFNLNNTLNIVIYEKALKYPSLCEKEFGTAEIINFSQVDAERMTWMGYQLSALIFTPIQLAIGIYLMYSYIGISFCAGIAVMVIIFVLTYWSSKKSIKYNEETLKIKDERMKVTQEFLDIIRYIKINAIEKFFFRKLDLKRTQQIKLIQKTILIDIMQVFLYWVSSSLILSATFLTYYLLGNQITAEIAFTVMMIFSLLQYPIRGFPASLSESIQMYTSVKRVQKYLLASQINQSFITEVQKENSRFAVKIENGTFYWGMEKQKEKQQTDKKDLKKQKKDQEVKDQKQQIIQKKKLVKIDEKQKEIDESAIEEIIEIDENGKQIKGKYIKALKNINIEILKGKFTIVIGDIGSGKSSLLNAILNEMKADKDSKIEINGSIAYSPQKPWIMSTTVRDNITFMLPYDKQKFQRVAYFSSLEKDLEILMKGDLTEIGEKGINLSGGQKARIAFARALYSEKQIYLLDDIISAVDVHVGDFLMQETILKMLKGKTVIMPTHAIKFAQFADEIIIMKKGVILQKGHYTDICESQEFIEIFKQEKEKEKNKKETEDEEDQKINEELRLINEIAKKKTKSEDVMEKEKKKQQKQVLQKIVEDLMLPEDHAVGEVDWKVFQQYAKLNGGALFILAFGGSFAMWIILSTLASIAIQKWCDDPIGQGLDMYLYLALSISSNIFVIFGYYALLSRGARQGHIVHKKMIKSLLYTSLTKFFNRVPVGRIVNRLTKDLGELDQTVGWIVTWFVVSFFQLCGTFLICIYSSTPYILIAIAVTGFLINRVKNFYMKTQREIVRLKKISSSPILSGFISAINGLGVIRAYGKQQQFIDKQLVMIDSNKRVRMTKEGLSQWFSMTLTTLSIVINIGSIGYLMLNSENNASFIGLLMTYTMNLNDSLIGITLSWTEVQNSMISLERIYTFTRIEPEIGYQKYCQKWRTKEEGYQEAFKEGQIIFKNASVRYRQDLPEVLKQINVKIKKGEKVGMVGRTGAGKSTLINTLLRITDLSEGQILIDGVNIMDYNLKDYRNSITMIDQEPTLINSTFRQNLDITHKYTDEDLFQILRECNLYDTILEKGGLDGAVSNDSLSAGEKQLLCICRAFLKQSKIVLIDEATANIDLKNDSLIQKVILTKFVDSTVLTIAHRLSTLKNSDKILVMGQEEGDMKGPGRILEWGSPLQLESMGGIYAEMVKKNMSQFLV